VARAALALEDGTVYVGDSFGGTGTASGEVCFNTSMTGYQEILTDPSYRGQILCMTAPQIGNYGVNPADVENAAWHFACVARDAGAAAARQALLPVGDDGRVPMKEILGLFAGTVDPAAVLAAAEAGPEAARRNQLCFAHLYLGLHAEAVGDAAKAREHMLLAAGPFSMNHYMGKVAQVHAALRGWKPAAAE
jgi:hypothetical protein